MLQRQPQRRLPRQIKPRTPLRLPIRHPIEDLGQQQRGQHRRRMRRPAPPAGIQAIEILVLEHAPPSSAQARQESRPRPAARRRPPQSATATPAATPFLSPRQVKPTRPQIASTTQACDQGLSDHPTREQEGARRHCPCRQIGGHKHDQIPFFSSSWTTEGTPHRYRRQRRRSVCVGASRHQRRTRGPSCGSELLSALIERPIMTKLGIGACDNWHSTSRSLWIDAGGGDEFALLADVRCGV